MSISPSWPVVGLVLILIGLMVKFEVQVIDPDDQKEIKRQKNVEGHN